MRLNWTIPLCVLLALGTGFAAGCDDGDDGDGDTKGGDGDGDGDGDIECGDEWAEKNPDNADPKKLPFEGFGLPCETPADCTDALGPDAICILNILNVYDIPEGFCSLDCEVPSDTVFVPDADDCSPNGGIDCVGIEGAFTACLPSCSDSAQCDREGYGCVQMPLISQPGDPTYCLMDADACCVDPGGSC